MNSIIVDSTHAFVIGLTARDYVNNVTHQKKIIDSSDIRERIIEKIDFHEIPNNLSDIYHYTNTGLGSTRILFGNYIEYHPYLQVKNSEKVVRADSHFNIILD